MGGCSMRLDEKNGLPAGASLHRSAPSARPGAHDVARHCERCEDLEWQIRELKRTLAPEIDVPPEWELTRAERTIFYAIRRTGAASFERLALLVDMRNRERSDGRAILRVHVLNMRKKLDRHGGPSIVSIWGWGYRIEKDIARAA